MTPAWPAPLAFGITGSTEGRVAADFSMIEGPYLNDILDQPRALEATLAGLSCPKELRALAQMLRNGEFRCVVLTGMGASFHALHPSNHEFIEHGIVSVMVETSELVHYQSRLLDPRTLIVAVSQSGQSVEMLRLLEANAGRSKIIAITNTARSPLAENASLAILTAAGKEFSVSCKTYVASLMALKWLSAALTDDDLQAVREELSLSSGAVAAYLQHWRQHAESLARRLDQIRYLFLVGRGPSLAAASTGALTIKESDHFPAEGMSSAAFRHGPFEMLSREILVLIFAGEGPARDLNLRLLGDIRDQGGEAELVDEESDYAPSKIFSVPQGVRPILEILPAQMFTLALAARIGREPGRFELASKVTTIE